MDTMRNFVILCFFVSEAFPAPQIVPPNENFKLIVLHNNDLHARFEQTGLMSEKCDKVDAEENKCFGGCARIAHKVREFRRRADAGETPKVLFLNAGDTYTGTPFFSLFKDEIAAEFLNILKPDAISLGNHEFDEGTANLAKFLRRVESPVLVANLLLDKEPELKALLTVPSKVFNINGRKVGVIGFLTPETKETSAGNEVEFIDEITAINDEANKLKADSVNIIFALGHSGFEREKHIAENCPDVDLVIGGHSHTFMYTGEPPSVEIPESDYPTIVEQKNGKKVPVVQAYAFSKYLGHLNLEFNGSGDLINISGKPILLNGDIPQDIDVLQLFDKYRPAVSSFEEKIGFTEVFLDGSSCRHHECNLGNLIADSMVDWRAGNHNSNGSWTDVSIALMVGGGVRASINNHTNNGTITREDATLVMPFRTKLDVVEITGESLKRALEHAVRRYNDAEKHGEFLQMSGVRVVYDLNRPSGNRVEQVEVLCSNRNIPVFEDLNEKKTYKIVMHNFVSIGGDGFDMFKDHIIEKTDALDIDVFIRYLTKISPVRTSLDGRIKIKIMEPKVTQLLASNNQTK